MSVTDLKVQIDSNEGSPQLAIRFAWQRSTQNGPLSESKAARCRLELDARCDSPEPGRAWKQIDLLVLERRVEGDLVVVLVQ